MLELGPLIETVRQSAPKTLGEARSTLRAPLTELLQKHINAAADEFVKHRGLAPDGMRELAAWDLAWESALTAALAGDVEDVVGDDRLEYLVINRVQIEALVDAILGNSEWICQSVFGRLPEIGEDLGRTVKVNLEGGSFTEIAKDDVITANPMVIPQAEVDVAFTTNVWERAGIAAIAALAPAACATDSELAENLGISRSKLINYRSRRTPWEPTREQMMTLREILFDYAHSLLDAHAQIEDALQEEMPEEGQKQGQDGDSGLDGPDMA